MKIILTSFSTRSAIGDYFYLLAKELAKKSDLFLLVPHYFNRNIEKVKVYKFKSGRNKFLALLNFLNPFNILKILNFINKTEPQIVHLFFGEGYPPAIILAIYLKLKKIPFVITLHDPEIHPGNFIEKLNGFFRIITLKLASGIHLHSKIFIENLKKLGIKEEKIFVIPHGSFAPLFIKFKKENIRKENIVLFFGRLEKYKGLEYFIRAGLKLKGKYKFIIAGPGKLGKNLLQIIQNNNEIFELHNRFLSEEEIAELFQKSKVCVLPYIQATQSAIPLISAFFGVSVVATKVGAFVEDVPRVNGILVEPANIDSLIEGILNAENVTPKYPKELEFSYLVNDFLKMYEEIIKSK